MEAFINAHTGLAGRLRNRDDFRALGGMRTQLQIAFSNLTSDRRAYADYAAARPQERSEGESSARRTQSGTLHPATAPPTSYTPSTTTARPLTETTAATTPQTRQRTAAATNTTPGGSKKTAGGSVPMVWANLNVSIALIAVEVF